MRVQRAASARAARILPRPYQPPPFRSVRHARIQHWRAGSSRQACAVGGCTHRKPEKEARLAHAGVADQHELEHVVVLLRAGNDATASHREARREGAQFE